MSATNGVLRILISQQETLDNEMTKTTRIKITITENMQTSLRKQSSAVGVTVSQFIRDSLSWTLTNVDESYTGQEDIRIGRPLEINDVPEAKEKLV